MGVMGEFPGGYSVVTARLQSFDVTDRPVIDWLPGHAGYAVHARSTVPLSTEMIGREVLVVHEAADPGRPIIIGVLQTGAHAASPARVTPAAPSGGDVDEPQHVVLTAQHKLVLRCGDSSITLTRAGKVIIRGNHILTQASGHHRIKGATVEIN